MKHLLCEFVKQVALHLSDESNTLHYLQVPLIFVTAYLKENVGPREGNICVWLSLVIGQGWWHSVEKMCLEFWN